MIYSVDFPPCSATQFQCYDKRCIDDIQRCDGKPDCHDSSDEDGCGMSAVYHDKMYKTGVFFNVRVQSDQGI